MQTLLFNHQNVQISSLSIDPVATTQPPQKPQVLPQQKTQPVQQSASNLDLLLSLNEPSLIAYPTIPLQQNTTMPKTSNVDLFSSLASAQPIQPIQQAPPLLMPNSFTMPNINAFQQQPQPLQTSIIPNQVRKILDPESTGPNKLAFFPYKKQMPFSNSMQSLNFSQQLQPQQVLAPIPQPQRPQVAFNQMLGIQTSNLNFQQQQQQQQQKHAKVTI
jgi:hypothetical protein